MKEWRKTAVCCAVLAALICATTLPDRGASYGDDEPATDQAQVEDDSSPRLPNYYGKLALNDEQRAQVYAIQNAYAEQIDALLLQIEDLRAARDAEMEDVLTPGQQLRLQELREAARAADEAEDAAEADTAEEVANPQ